MATLTRKHRNVADLVGQVRIRPAVDQPPHRIRAGGDVQRRPAVLRGGFHSRWLRVGCASPWFACGHADAAMCARLYGSKLGHAGPSVALPRPSSEPPPPPRESPPRAPHQNHTTRPRITPSLIRTVVVWRGYDGKLASEWLPVRDLPCALLFALGITWPCPSSHGLAASRSSEYRTRFTPSARAPAASSSLTAAPSPCSAASIRGVQPSAPARLSTSAASGLQLSWSADRPRPCSTCRPAVKLATSASRRPRIYLDVLCNTSFRGRGYMQRRSQGTRLCEKRSDQLFGETSVTYTGESVDISFCIDKRLHNVLAVSPCSFMQG